MGLTFKIHNMLMVNSSKRTQTLEYVERLTYIKRNWYHDPLNYDKHSLLLHNALGSIHPP